MYWPKWKARVKLVYAAKKILKERILIRVYHRVLNLCDINLVV